MKLLYQTTIETIHGQKELAVYEGDVLSFPDRIDVLTASAYHRSYAPTPHTLFEALAHADISVRSLAEHPELDLRRLCDVWLSEPILSLEAPIRRIGCIEMTYFSDGGQRIPNEEGLLRSLKAYFGMLDIATAYDEDMKTVVLPLLGAGSQHLSTAMTLFPTINECVAFLKRNSVVKRICFVEKDAERAALIADTLQGSLLLAESLSVRPVPHKSGAACEPRAQATAPRTPVTAFLSYSSGDKNIADNLCAKLEAAGIRVWYAPRDVRGPYAEAIANAISRSTLFIVILSQNSIRSEHVLNEIDLAFQSLPDRIKFKPLRIVDILLTPSFRYYLSRQHWMDAIDPPLEEHLDRFVQNILSDPDV